MTLICLATYKRSKRIRAPIKMVCSDEETTQAREEQFARLEEAMSGGRPCDTEEPDPRDPDPSRPGIFRDHNCWRCGDGKKPCVNGHPHRCEYPHARYD